MQHLLPCPLHSISNILGNRPTQRRAILRVTRAIYIEYGFIGMNINQVNTDSAELVTSTKTPISPVVWGKAIYYQNISSVLTLKFME